MGILILPSLSAKGKPLFWLWLWLSAAWPGLQSAQSKTRLFEGTAAFAKWVEAAAALEDRTDEDYCEYGCYAKVTET